MADDRNDIVIENNVATWELRTEGPIMGTFSGIFRFKCYLSPIEQIKSNREYRELIGPNHLTLPEHESFLAYALCQLKYRIISAPPFWTSSLQTTGFSGDIPDENVISDILTAAMDSELKYRNQLKKKKDEALEKAKKAAEKILAEERQENQAGEDEG